MTTMPEIAHEKGDSVDGFTFDEVTPLPSLRAVAYRITHRDTGARLFHVHADDEENLFSISFPTLPEDHRGVAHILEHSVLSGSKRYPVRDPFFEMVKMSMATFINAMTGWDCTYYPVASNVKRDLFNLADVYFDAVFFPLLTEETFRREGHHLAVDKDGRLTIKGIVYNEMKGVFSDPRSTMYRRMTRLLFPDTVYGWESGGDPRYIPDLTHADLVAFHRRFYHAGNAYFVMYGDIPTREHLEFLAPRIADLERRDPAPAVAPQPRWSAPRTVEETYPISSGDREEEGTFIALHWLIGSALDVEESALFAILDLLLFGNEAAPLKKAVIDSGLGQDILYSGASPVGLENTFCLGIKGSEPDRAAAFERVVFDTLEQLASRPFEAAAVETAFRQAAFHVREIQSQYPLTTMERVLESWIYGSDPVAFLRLAEHLDRCHERIARDPALLPGLIRERLIDNPHRLLGVLKPDKEHAAREERELEERLEGIRRRLSEEEIARIAREAEELEKKSGIPNSKEALATLPQLRVRDLPQRPRHIDTEVERAGSIELLRNDVFANGVSYLALDFDLRGLPAELFPYLSCYTDSIEKMGIEGAGYDDVARRVAAVTGGVSISPYFETRARIPEPLVRVRLTVKMLDELVPEAMDLVGDLVFSTDPGDKPRMRDVLQQARSWVRNHLVHQGSSTAVRYAARSLSLPASLTERVYGLPQLDLYERLVGDFEREFPALVERIVAIRDFVVQRGRLAASFTGSERAFERVRETLFAWEGRMRDASSFALPPFEPDETPRREGLSAPIQVAHCALCLPAPHFSDEAGVYLNLGARMLALDHLINEIRFKGNAYGASCAFDGLDQVFSFHSYRDPNVARTLGVFRGSARHIREADWTVADIERAIIGTAKHDGAPIRPGPATSMALSRHLRGYDPQYREERYERLLAARAEDVRRAMLDLLEAGMERASICVVANEDMLRRASEELDRPLDIRPVLDANSAAES